MKIVSLNLNEDKARELFTQSYELFKGVINKEEGIYDYDRHFDWNTLEEVHEDHMNSGTDDSDYYFKYNEVLYTLDISHNIEDFGYNSLYFQEKYGKSYEDLYCCVIYSYRQYYEYDDVKTEVVFLYNKKLNKIVEILEVCHHSLKIDDKKTIRSANYKVLDEITKSFH